MRIEYHRTLIADRVRNAAFHAALTRVIVPGETIVTDIGAGTGLLGFMAAKLGAKRVFMYESEAVAGVASRIGRDNRLKTIEIIPGHSTEMAQPPRADVVVSETLGNYALEENIVATMTDARKRHLEPDGVLIPGRVMQWVAPVVSSRVASELTAWDAMQADYGLDFKHARAMSLNNVYVRTLQPADLAGGMAGAKIWDTVDLGRDGRSNRSGEARWTATSPLTVYGFALWWVAELLPGLALSTAPDAPLTHWEQLYLPLLEPMVAADRDSYAITIRSKSSYDGGTDLAWSATLTDSRGRHKMRQSMELDKGWLP